MGTLVAPMLLAGVASERERAGERMAARAEGSRTMVERLCDEARGQGTLWSALGTVLGEG